MCHSVLLSKGTWGYSVRVRVPGGCDPLLYLALVYLNTR